MPPRIPQELEPLDRAIMLLGSISKGMTLTTKKADELEELLGVIPGAELAAFWKTELKKMRRELTQREADA